MLNKTKAGLNGSSILQKKLVPEIKTSVILEISFLISDIRALIVAFQGKQNLAP